MKHVGDITKLNGAELEPVWCITGGSPCQDLSVAGKRAGLAGARSGLFMEQVRLVKEMRENDKRNGRTGDMVRPRYMVWENVPGAFSSNFSDGFGDFGAVLEEVIRVAEPTFSLPRLEGKQKWTKSGAIDGDGWSVAWRTHDAQYWGVPQRRRRISLVADFGGSSAGEILFERESLSGNPEQSEPQRKETAGDFAESTGVHDRVAVPKLGILNPADSQGNQAEDGTAPTIIARGPGAVAYAMPSEPTLASGKETTGCLMASGYDKLGAQEMFSGDYTVVEPKMLDGSDVCPTLTANNAGGNQRMPDKDNFNAVAYGISSYESNAMKSANPNSGIYEADTSRTIDVSGGNSACNQGGVAVCEPVACLETFHCTAEENMTQPLKARDYKDPLCVAYAEPAWNGKCDGVNEEVSFTQNATDRHGVAYKTTPHLYQDTVGALCMDDYKGTNRQYVDPDKCIVEKAIRWIVRRLTPLECTRLQGFPDGWIEIGEWVDSEGKKHKDADSPKYKALGNSIALPFWYWMFCRMAKYLPRDATLGSLFDGIGGFPICWEAIHGRGTARWASEIEEFPIAVTKMRFGED